MNAAPIHRQCGNDFNQLFDAMMLVCIALRIRVVRKNAVFTILQHQNAE